MRAGATGSLGSLPHESSSGPLGGRRDSNVGPMPEETPELALPAACSQPILGAQSDRLVVVLKPGNAGGAKGATRREERCHVNCDLNSPKSPQGMMDKDRTAY